MDIKLIFFKPDGSRRDVSLSPGEYVIGRGDKATLRLPIKSISRAHCVVIFDGKRARVRDMSSLNGTYVNDARVQGEQGLSAGDVLRLGDCLITVQIDGKPVQVEKPVRKSSAASSMMDTPGGPGGMPAIARRSEEADGGTRQPGSASEGSSAFDFDFDFSEKDE